MHELREYQRLQLKPKSELEDSSNVMQGKFLGADGKYHPSGSFIGADGKYHPQGYFVGQDGKYHPSGSFLGRDGKYHRITVQVVPPRGLPKLSAHWRLGYNAPVE